MKKADKISHKLPERDGMTVPDGYFADFARRMEAALPERPELTESAVRPVNRSTWQRIRPYVYMAAMFAGVWCMLKLFTAISSPELVPMESNPVIAEAFSNDTFVDDYVYSDLNQWDVYDDLMEDGFYPESFLDSIPFDY